MYYELYVDIVFVVNVIMDYILLMVVKKILKCNTTHFRILLGSMIGGLGVCILVIIPTANIIIRIILGYIVTSTCMVRVGCNLKGKKNLVKGVLSLYVLVFVAGGIFQALSHYMDIDNWLNNALMGSSSQSVEFRTFLVLSVISYIMILCGIKILERLRNKVRNTYDITLYEKGKKKEVIGFLDTGNHLKDPFSGKPVSILDYKTIQGLVADDVMDTIVSMGDFKEAEMTGKGKIRYIPFHSVGKEHGMLPAITIDLMNIQVGEQAVLIQDPVFAVCKQPVSAKKEYQVILNPILIDD